MAFAGQDRPYRHAQQLQKYYECDVTVLIVCQSAQQHAVLLPVYE